MAEKTSRLHFLTDGIVKENPVLRLVLGTCPTLAVTTSLKNGFGMGIAAMVVLICSNLVISLLRNIIPQKVRIPAFITIIAAFVTLVQMLLQAYVVSIYNALGIYLPLIVVNCIILARAEVFASKHAVLESVLDGAGMGIGFTAALCCMGLIREVLGTGMITLSDSLVIPLQGSFMQPMLIFILPPGGFFVFGLLIALSNKIAMKQGKKPVQSIGCSACPGKNVCELLKEGNERKPEEEDLFDE